MATSVNNKCKAFTSLKQSKKLAEILPLESADMYYDVNSYGVRTTPEVLMTSIVRKKDIPCWSLAALLNILPDESDIIKGKVDVEDDKYMCTTCVKEELITAFGNNPVDACYKMILKLHEQKLL